MLNKEYLRVYICYQPSRYCHHHHHGCSQCDEIQNDSSMSLLIFEDFWTVANIIIILGTAYSVMINDEKVYCCHFEPLAYCYCPCDLWFI